LFFKYKDGKWAIVAFPNVLLAAWIAIIILTKFIPENNLHLSLSLLGSAVLFVWAYLELTDGTSYFRRVLGVAILLAVIISSLAKKDYQPMVLNAVWLVVALVGIIRGFFI